MFKTQSFSNSQIPMHDAIFGRNSSKLFASVNLINTLQEARTDKTLAAFVCDEFKRDVGSKTIVFYSPISSHLGYVSNSSIIINDFKLFSLMLKVVGHLIEDLEIKYSKTNLDQRMLIHYLIKKHCSKSLTTFRMTQVDQDVLLSFDSSLENVQNLILTGDLSTKPFFIRGFVYSRETMSLNEIFPGIHHLTIESMFVSDPSIFQHKFPQLIDLKIIFFPTPMFDLWKNYYYKTKPAMKNLFDYNPQIRSLTLSNCNSLDYLKIASDRLKRLDYLQINLLPLKEKYTGKPFYFRKVRNLDVKMDSVVELFNVVSFSRLEEMNLICNANDCGRFPFYSITLKKLSVSGYTFENQNTLTPRQLPYLEVLTITNEKNTDLGYDDLILSYIERSSYLMNVKFMNHSETFYDTLKQYDIEGWSVEKNGSTVILKNSMSVAK